MSARQMTLTALMTALVCIAGPLTLPLGPVPLTLTNAALMLCALILRSGRSLLCCMLYLLIGLTGLPVFSGFTGGAGAFAGPTGGFLMGYLPMTALCAWGFSRPQRHWHVLGCLAGLAVLDLAGAAWYAWQSGSALLPALTVCALPFLPADLAKIILVLTAGPTLQKRLKNLHHL